MASIALKKQSGAEAGTVDLDDAVFGLEPNVPVMHQVVVAQLAAARAGTQSTKTRAEVSGGGAKPFKQKGTGRARAGSTRSPNWRGGGVALGPKPRNYDQRTPKKMKKLALRSALSDRAADDKVIVVDDWGFDTPSTAGARKALAALGVSGRALVVLTTDDVVAWKSFRNLGVGARHHARRAQHLRRAGLRLRRVHPGQPAQQRTGHRRRICRWQRQSGRQVKDPHEIIIRPVVSEKSYGLIDANVYTFVVAPSATKIEIRQAVEAIWPGRKVVKVNTLNRKGKSKRGRRTRASRPSCPTASTPSSPSPRTAMTSKSSRPAERHAHGTS